jgi:uncharacterized protein (TIGR02679 family)
MARPCSLCDGTCAAASTAGLATDDLEWFWAQLAATGDRRGDATLDTGRVTVNVPDDVAGRTAAAGLLARRHLRPRTRVTVDLAGLAARIAPLTPGAVAAHATGRRLAVKAAERAARTESETQLRHDAVRLLPALADDGAWAALRRSRWVSRALSGEGAGLFDRAAAVIRSLPGPGEPAIDRRRLAQEAATEPHDLDAGRPTGGLVLAILAATGVVEAGLTARQAWASVGVSYDDITGGLTMIGVAPNGWVIPAGAPVTVPPRVLADCTWPHLNGATVFVTENPSVLGAGAAIDGARIVCTSGTPSQVEVDALARLAAAGCELAVRADFDDAGLRHCRAVLAAATPARPWRMGSADYLSGVAGGEQSVAIRHERLVDTPWDPDLRHLIAERGVAVYEESLLDDLLDDIRRAAGSGLSKREGAA